MKVIEIKFTNEKGKEVSTFWVGNEYSKDPSEVLLIVAGAFKTKSISDASVSLNISEPENTHLNETIQRIMKKAGYEWVVPKSIILS